MSAFCASLPPLGVDRSDRGRGALSARCIAVMGRWPKHEEGGREALVVADFVRRWRFEPDPVMLAARRLQERGVCRSEPSGRWMEGPLHAMLPARALMDSDRAARWRCRQPARTGREAFGASLTRAATGVGRHMQIRPLAFCGPAGHGRAVLCVGAAERRLVDLLQEAALHAFGETRTVRCLGSEGRQPTGVARLPWPSGAARRWPSRCKRSHQAFCARARLRGVAGEYHRACRRCAPHG